MLCRGVPRLGVQTYFGECQIRVIDQKEIGLLFAHQLGNLGERSGHIDCDQVPAHEFVAIEVIKT